METTNTEPDIKQDKVLNASIEDLNIIASISAKELSRIKRRYTDAQLQMLEDRARLLNATRSLRKRLKFWEAGIVNNLSIIIPSLLLVGILGYIFGEKLIDFSLQFGRNKKVWGCIIFGSYAGLCFNLYDLGRLNLNWKKFYRKQDEIQQDEDLVEFVQRGEKNDGLSKWLLAKELKKMLEYERSTIELGRVLTDYGFATKPTKRGKKYFVKIAMLEEDEEPEKEKKG